MKIEFLEKIVGKIQHEIHCPKCKNVFAKGNLEICSITNKQIEFSSFCHICGISSQIVADLNIQDSKKPLTSNQVAEQPTKHPVTPTRPAFLNPDQVQQITQSLATFKGRDVKELFQ